MKSTNNMVRKHCHMPKELFEWAKKYVAEHEIRGPQGNISFSELVRSLLVEKKENVPKETHTRDGRKLNTITIERRPDDYMVYLNGDKTVWECDRVPDRAIVSLIKRIGQNIFPIGPYEYKNSGINYPIDYFTEQTKENGREKYELRTEDN